MTLTAEDKALRLGKITSSSAAACLGLDPYCSPLRAWLRIMGRDDGDAERERGEDDGAEASADVRDRGHWIEPSLIAYGAHWLEQDTSGRVTYERQSTIVHPDLPWLGDTMDALYRIDPPDGSETVLVGCEAKDVAQPHAHRWGEAPDGIVPDYVKIQCAIHAMHYPETRCMLVPTLIGSMHVLSCYVLERDRDLEFALVEALGQWHRHHVVANEPPPATIARDNKLLSKLWRGDGLAHPDDPVIAELSLRDVELREEIERLKADRDRGQIALKERLRDHTECRGEWGSVTWRRAKSSVKTDHAKAFGELRGRVREGLASIGVDHLPFVVGPGNVDDMTIDGIADAILRDCSREKQGARPLRTYAKKAKAE